MRLIEEIISISMYFLVPVWIVFIGRFINKNTCWSTLDDCDHKNIMVNYKRLYYLRIGDLVISGFVQMGFTKSYVVIKPGLFFRLIGFNAKKINIANLSRSGNEWQLKIVDKMKDAEKIVVIKTLPNLISREIEF
jgi:hypothetical protein